MIVWAGQATHHLDQAHDYIALSNSEEVAARITMHIVTSVQQLATFPMSGRPGRAPGTPRVGYCEYSFHRCLQHRQRSRCGPRNLPRLSAVARGIPTTHVGADVLVRPGRAPLGREFQGVLARRVVIGRPSGSPHFPPGHQGNLSLPVHRVKLSLGWSSTAPKCGSLPAQAFSCSWSFSAI